jgi:predicted DNA-binding transcriptional regulator YafY
VPFAEDYRYFRVSRMSELALNGATFTPREMQLPQRESVDGGWNKGGRMVELDLAFDKEMASGVHDSFSDATITMTDGRLRVKANLPDCNWMYGFLLSFGPTLEVLSPEHVRRSMAESAKAIAHKYHSE